MGVIGCVTARWTLHIAEVVLSTYCGTYALCTHQFMTGCCEKSIYNIVADGTLKVAQLNSCGWAKKARDGERFLCFPALWSTGKNGSGYAFWALLAWSASSIFLFFLSPPPRCSGDPMEQTSHSSECACHVCTCRLLSAPLYFV